MGAKLVEEEAPYKNRLNNV